MRRMLVRQIAAKRDAISAAPRKGDDDDGEVTVTRDGRLASVNRRSDSGAGAPDNTPDKPATDTVADTFTRARNYSYYESTLGSSDEYAPGLGAILSVTVPVKAHLVTTEPRSADARKPAETKSADDEAWDKVARGEDASVERRVKMLVGADGKEREETQRELRYDEAAVKALKETVVDTIARFGGRVGLGHGERLAVVVTLSAGSIVREGDGGGSGEKKGKAVKGEAAAGDGTVEGRSGVADFMYFNDAGSNALMFGGRTMVPGRRIVFQVSGDDLRALRNGDLERDDLVRKTRIEEFAVPGASRAASNSLNWFRAPK
jgi:hypothetical protein